MSDSNNDVTFCTDIHYTYNREEGCNLFGHQLFSSYRIDYTVECRPSAN